ncbi:MAG: hypothetical protein SFU86_11350 [Pirellulaceae bacterium]|nr:hypothetical protein [Pirellulaceae bacterium]
MTFLLLALALGIDVTAADGPADDKEAIRALLQERALLGKDRDGMVTSVTFRHPFDEDALDGIARLPRCHTIHLAGTKIRDDELERLRECRQVRVVRIFTSAVTNRGGTTFAECPQLDVSHITNSQVSRSCVESIANHRHLQKLVLDVAIRDAAEVSSIKNACSRPQVASRQSHPPIRGIIAKSGDEIIDDVVSVSRTTIHPPRLGLYRFLFGVFLVLSGRKRSCPPLFAMR